MESVFPSILLGLLSSFLLGKSIEATSIQNRIVGGYDAEIGSVPYQVSLRDDLNGHFCGGSILNKRWVLTAAHCIDSDRLDSIYVGSNFLNRKGRIYDVEKKIVHEKYDPKTTDTDIGLIKVKEDIEFSDLVQPIKPYRGDIKGGEILKATGWGLLYDSAEEPPNTLQEVMLTALSDKECAKRGTKAPNHLCTFVKEDVGVCNGDSGGPLVNEDGEQVGITSFTLMSCANELPDYFSKVSLFGDWIDKHVKGDES